MEAFTHPGWQSNNRFAPLTSPALASSISTDPRAALNDYNVNYKY